MCVNAVLRQASPPSLIEKFARTDAAVDRIISSLEDLGNRME